MIFKVNNAGGVKVHLLYNDTNIDNSLFNHLKEKGLFSAKLNEIFASSFDNTILLGLGKKEDLSLNDLREVFFNLHKKLQVEKISEIEINVSDINIDTKKLAEAITEGLLQATYSFNIKSEKKELIDITVNYTGVKDEKAFLEGIEEAKVLTESIFLTRDMVNLPANYIFPETMAKKAKEILEPLGVKVSVYNKKQIQEMGMEAFYSVGKGSDKEPMLIVMEYYNNNESRERLALVGKGITYDSGGYSIKTRDGMKTMFDDMAGGATVIGTMNAIAKSKIKTNVVGIVAACENLVSGRSYKPGDIIGSLSGKTIEIDNTDAEGRVTLADSVYYASSVKGATKIIDLATLTGACVMTLGEYYTGAMTNDQEFLNELMECSKEAGERIWQLPMDDQFKKLNNSDVADIKNSGGRFAGSITAGMFIAEFNDNKPWIHLDIAGTAFLSSPYSYLTKGATGVHIKTLYNLLRKG